MAVIDFTVVKKKYCRHERIEVDEYQETVECADCGAILSPFHVLLRIAKGQDRKRYLDEDGRRIKAEIAGAKRELERLKQQIRYCENKG